MQNGHTQGTNPLATTGDGVSNTQRNVKKKEKGRQKAFGNRTNCDHHSGGNWAKETQGQHNGTLLKGTIRDRKGTSRSKPLLPGVGALKKKNSNKRNGSERKKRARLSELWGKRH